MMKKQFFLLTVLALCANAVFSSFRCSFSKEIGYNINSLTCVLRHVCIDSLDEDGFVTWKYFVKSVDKSFVSKNLFHREGSMTGTCARLGYRKGLDMRIKLVDNEELDPSSDAITKSVTLGLMCAPSSNYAHFILDSMLGTHWMLSHIPGEEGTMSPREKTLLMNVCKKPAFADSLFGIFTLAPTLTAADMVGKCYDKVVVGPAGHYSLFGIKSGTKVSTTLDDFKSFQSYIRKMSGAKEADGNTETRIALVSRTKAPKIGNVEELKTQLSSIAPVDVLNLKDLTMPEQISILSNTRIFIVSNEDDYGLVAFLPAGALVVEIVPFGTESKVLKEFCKTYGIRYTSWKNTRRDKTEFNRAPVEEFAIKEKDVEKITSADHYDSKTMPWTAEFVWKSQTTTVDVDELKKIIAPEVEKNKKEAPKKEEEPKKEETPKKEEEPKKEESPKKEEKKHEEEPKEEL